MRAAILDRVLERDASISTDSPGARAISICNGLGLTNDVRLMTWHEVENSTASN